ncbi:Prolyl oligopeptidase family protein [Legionella quinlivanii]|uniref:Prolyl oligopeptidase family protein n=1 Tax=Legionella quinlivanii TaxID=45073 RepID=A0A0W0Y0P2_9GAMM|nr:prolyl oligopeptidase family serine peptidase [Legionella quinlivanii]KTD50271.1 Prolyl oligopeptidase family protein [Legionella quinlivanii]SEF45154.1 Prolyl oligopeptidase family protein [Legionella quinlivanii DSM 21216]STY11870.1 Prolyl oligopeptidase family [Legionella quinlivanii]
MTPQTLIELYIKQKNKARFSTSKIFQEGYKKAFQEATADVEIVASDEFAPPLFEGQPSIPFVLFKPKTVNAERPAPLIIHTHGGPNVYMSKDNLHAEIAYFLTHGFVVACPNYRGSTDYPVEGKEKEDWLKWKDLAKDKHHIYGPQDIYAVTQYMLAMGFINSPKAILRGGSFGSFINAHLLAQVKKGIFENLFSGAHFSGGVKYPHASSMPTDIPILITHSEKDDIAPYSDAQIFMEHLLLQHLSIQIEGKDTAALQTYVATRGDHHMIDPDLGVGLIYNPTSLAELTSYIIYTTSFVHSLVDGNTFQNVDCYDQYKQLMSNRAEKPEDQAYLIVNQARIVERLRATPFTEEPPQPEPAPFDKLQSASSYTPTTGLLKLYLGDHYTGDVRTDFTWFLKHCFRPVNWTATKEVLTDAGKQMLENEQFVDQIVTMIEREKSFLAEHPDYVPLYHTAEYSSMQLYCFINLWIKTLRAELTNRLSTITEMRLVNFIKNSIDNIDIFLLKWRRLHSNGETFNNILGAPDRIAACNPSSISNSHSTASSSLWWYFKAAYGERTPFDELFGDFFRILEIYSPQRCARYKHFFERAYHGLQGKPQALMQQIFLPKKLAHKKSYMCQIWGEEFSHNDMELSSPNSLELLRSDPEQFEMKLREQKHAFQNFGNCPGFGDTDNGFKYAGLLQNRWMAGELEGVVIYSHFRDEKQHQAFVAELSELVLEDFSDFLANATDLHDSVIPGTYQTKLRLYEEWGLFKRPTRVSDHLFYKQQLQLFRGEVENPQGKTFELIFQVDRDSKIKMQERLRQTNGGDPGSKQVFIYSLCRYLKGYTYYELLEEIAKKAILEPEENLKKKYPPDYLRFAPNNYPYFMSMVQQFSTPDAVEAYDLSSNGYHEFYKLCHDKIRGLSYRDSGKDESDFFLETSKGTCYAVDLWDMELWTAIECALRHARLCKEKNNGHDVRSRVERLY